MSIPPIDPNNVPDGAVVKAYLVTKAGKDLIVQVLRTGIDTNDGQVHHALIETLLVEMGMPSDLVKLAGSAVLAMVKDNDVATATREALEALSPEDRDMFNDIRAAIVPLAMDMPPRRTPPSWVEEMLRAEGDLYRTLNTEEE